MSDPVVRDRPSQRFAADPAKKLDLREAIARLRTERGAESGHRQISLMREGPTSLLLFAFDAGGHLKEHRAPGAVCIQVLRGRLRVTADSRAYDLSPSELLFLNHDVPHGLLALDECDVLVFVQGALAA
jgi:quercetin dioxygenase-like cupin family protein